MYSKFMGDAKISPSEKDYISKELLGFYENLRAKDKSLQEVFMNDLCTVLDNISYDFNDMKHFRKLIKKCEQRKGSKKSNFSRTQYVDDNGAYEGHHI